MCPNMHTFDRVMAYEIQNDKHINLYKLQYHYVYASMGMSPAGTPWYIRGIMHT